jgi:CheY-like chemotaxis protein
MKQRFQILVADDEPIVRRSIQMLLEHDGHEVFAADSGETALAQLAQRDYDLVITDFSMPGMHGDQLAARIRKIRPEQPIIMATAFVEEYEVFGQGFGPVDAMLLKPFSLLELREAIERVMTPAQPGQDLVTPDTRQPRPASPFIPPPAH